MRICGFIHMIELDSKIIGIKSYKKINFFYFQNSQMSLFKRYLYQGNWIDLEYEDNKLVKKGKYLAYTISYIYRLDALGKNDHITYYDKISISKSLYKFINSLGNIMFLDLEMTMPSYQFKGKGFKTELIQAGYIIVGSNKEELCRYSNYVIPKNKMNFTKRVENFLGITQSEFYQQAIPYIDFYNDFRSALEDYNPVIVVYGKNDILVLNDSYGINEVPSLATETRFINLCQIIKSHYDLRNDPGLFKMYKLYYNAIDTQIHDAFDDCDVTRKVFEAFSEDLKNNDKGELIRKELEF